MPEIRGEITGDASGFRDASRQADRALQDLKREGDRSSRSLSASFKGLGGELKALGGAFVSVAKVAAATGAALAGIAAIGSAAAISAAREQIRVENQLSAVLESTGMAAGITKDELLSMAAGLQQVTNFGDEAIISAEGLLLTFTQIGRDVFPAALKTVLNMSAALGQGLRESAIQVGKALNDPIRGLTSLRRVGVSFTEQQEQLIRRLVETGDVAEAQGVILEELAKEFGGSAEAQADAMTQLGNTLGDLAEDFGETLIPIVDKAAVQISALVPFITEATERFGVMASEFNEGGGLISGALGLVADTLNAIKDPVAAIIAGFEFLADLLEVTVIGALAGAATGAQVLTEVLTRGVAGAADAFARLAALLGQDELARGARSLADQVEEINQGVAGLAESLREQVAGAVDELDSFEDTFIGVRQAFDEAEQAARDMQESVEEAGEAFDEKAEAVDRDTASTQQNTAAANQNTAATQRNTAAVQQNVAAQARARRFGRFGGEAARQPVEGGGAVLIGGAGGAAGGFAQGSFVVTSAGLRAVDPATGAIQGLQTGGRIQRGGLFRLEPGEFVVNRQTTEAIGPLLLAAINRAGPTINVGGVSISGRSDAATARAEARRLLPELERAFARGLRRAGIG